ncbi:30S ribosomal protein S6 [Gammaproteobacteria bacterium]|nr:30S ribosomal protein S6 [Gammaproteobacteria bacterium]
MTDINFKINKLENIGRRQLAYSILNHNKGHYAILQIEGPSESALELESKLKYDTSVIRHLLLKVDYPSLEDSLLLVESREAKKSPTEDPKQEKPKVTPAVKNNTDETAATEKPKGDES